MQDSPFQSINQVETRLAEKGYICDRPLATSIFLSLKLSKPLFLEGEAGVGKTEVAKVLSSTLDRGLIRLQCYEGLDLNSAVYEWNYSRQLLHIRLLEATAEENREKLSRDIFGPEFLL
ncbi:MAG TPA: MoxR family ATPase, partial [Acidobacteriota bacterium]|nr:MoxR family ATPase [Acidobacteriota bacterium]